MVKRATSSKTVSRKSAPAKKTKRPAAVKTRKKTVKKVSKAAGTKVASKPARKTATTQRTRTGASKLATSGSAKKSTAKAKAVKRKVAKRKPGPKTARATVPASARRESLPAPAERRRAPKSYLTKKQLVEFRRMLLAKRAELAGDVQHLTHDAFDRKGQGRGEQSAMPIHMADLGSDNWEKEFTLGLIENEQALIREIDEALARIEDRTYGMCLATHQKISLARLTAKPWAKYCIAYAQAREEGRVR